jgi:hypothetical protein
MLAGAVVLLALPSAVLAITARFDPEPLASATAQTRPAEAPPVALSRPIPVRSLAKGQLFPFTPAATPNQPDRSITVAVRLNAGEEHDISAQQLRDAANGEGKSALMGIAPTAFNLGVSRGYRSFSQDLVEPAEDRVDKLEDYDRFSLTPGKPSTPSRFSPRIVIDEKQRAGQAPRTFAGDRQDRVDVGGSYRISKHFDVTAGVRYADDRERLLPLTDGMQDSQAVYVGTQVRF